MNTSPGQNLVTHEATPNSPSTTAPLYLLTGLGTILFYDEALGQVRHAPFSEGLQNLAFLSAPGRRSLAVLRDRTWVPLWASPRLTPLDQGCVGLRVDDNFLHPSEAGTVAFEPISNSNSGSFLYPLTSEHATFLRHFLSNDWRSAANGAIVRPHVAGLENGFMIRIGELEVSLENLLAARDTGDPYQKTIAFLYDGWKIDRLVLYRPLVYFTAFGRPDIFACLDLALQSLAEYGEYLGDILVLTDKSPEEFAKLVAFRSPKLNLVRHQANDFLDFCLARYSLMDWPSSHSFQPILYLDTDVLCVAPIGKILQSVLAAPAMCAVLEHDLFSLDGYYGANLFRDDPTARPKIPSGLNTGVLGLPNIEAVRHVFSAIRRHALPIALANGSRDWSGCYDQPVANYVLHKAFSFDADVLKGRVRSSLYEPDVAFLEGGPEFFHFSGGVGAADPKLIQMRACMKRLRGEAPQAPSSAPLP